MSRQHNSFLLRCWRLNGRLERVEIEHIQSGRKTLTASLAAAIDWIGWIGANEDNAGHPPGARPETNQKGDPPHDTT